MTDVTDESPMPEREKAERGVWDWSAVAGIAFAPLFIAAFMVTPGSPHYSYTFASDQKWQDWATDTGYGLRYLLSVYLLMVASLALVVFVTGLARRIRIARGEASLAAGSVFGLGLLGAGLIAAGSVAWNTGPIFFLFDDDLAEQMNREIYAHIWILGHLLIFAGMTLAVAAVIGIVSASLRHSMPRWFTIFGYVVAAMQVGGALLLPALFIPIWTLTAGILLLRRPLDA